MLQEAEVDGHRVLLVLWHIGHTREESLLVEEGRVGDDLAEVHVEGRIAHHVVEHLLHLPVLQVPPVRQRVALYHVWQRVYQIVQYQVQPEHRRALLALVLRIDGAAVRAYLVSQGYHQRARPGSRVASCHALQVFVIVHQQPCHDGSHGVGRVVLRILAAAVLVVVGYQILEDGGEEVVTLSEHLLEVECDQIVHQCPGEVVTAVYIRHVHGDGIKQGHVALP